VHCVCVIRDCELCEDLVCALSLCAFCACVCMSDDPFSDTSKIFNQFVWKYLTLLAIRSPGHSLIVCPEAVNITGVVLCLGLNNSFDLVFQGGVGQIALMKILNTLGDSQSWSTPDYISRSVNHWGRSVSWTKEILRCGFPRQNWSAKNNPPALHFSKIFSGGFWW